MPDVSIVLVIRSTANENSFHLAFNRFIKKELLIMTDETEIEFQLYPASAGEPAVWVSFIRVESEPCMYGADADGRRGEIGRSVEARDIRINGIALSVYNDPDVASEAESAVKSML